MNEYEILTEQLDPVPEPVEELPEAVAGELSEDGETDLSDTGMEEGIVGEGVARTDDYYPEEAFTTPTETVTYYNEEQINDLISQVMLSNDLLEAQQLYQEQTIWEKPLEEYTVTEGIATISFFMFLSVYLFALIGGIIKWRRS